MRQAWITNNEFDYIVKNSQKVLKLNDQYKNHPYVEEFAKQCSVMFIYGTYKTDVKSFLDKPYEDMKLPTKNIRSSTEHRGHQANTQDHDGWRI